MGVAQAADVTAQAVATWSATAKKDTTSKLVVTPLGSLAFQYAEGIKGFNSQKGLFDVAIEGDTTATAFKLTSRLITNTLTQLDTSGSTLSVGVDYNSRGGKNWRYRDDRYRQQYYGRQPQRAG